MKMINTAHRECEHFENQSWDLLQIEQIALKLILINDCHFRLVKLKATTAMKTTKIPTLAKSSLVLTQMQLHAHSREIDVLKKHALPDCVYLLRGKYPAAIRHGQGHLSWTLVISLSQGMVLSLRQGMVLSLRRVNGRLPQTLPQPKKIIFLASCHVLLESAAFLSFPKKEF